MELYASDALRAVAWIIVTGFLVSAGWRLSGWLAPNDSLCARALRTTVCFWAVVVGVATILGIAGILVSIALLSGVALVAAFFWWIARSTPGDGQPDLVGLRLWAALFLFWSGHIALHGILRFPTDWDTLMYHLPLVDQWLQAESLYAPRDAIWYNPGNNELIGLWLVAPFSGDFLIALNNVPAVSALILAGMGVAEQLGLQRRSCLLCGFGLAANHVVFLQITDAKNDVAVAGLFLTGLYFATQFNSTGRKVDLFFAAITIGLLAGIKYYAIGYAAIVGAYLVLGTFISYGRRAAIGALLVGILGAVVFGGYWYIRNYCLTGTPIYPKGLTEETDVLSRSDTWRNGIWTTTILGSGRWEVLPLLVAAVQGLAGPCHVLALILLPATATWLIVSRGMCGVHEARTQLSSRAMIVLPLIGSALVWVITPWAIEIEPGTLNMLRQRYSPIRFGLSFLSLNLIVLILIGQDLSNGLGALATKLRNERVAEKVQLLVKWLPFLFLFAGAAYAFCREVSTVMLPAGLYSSLSIGGNVFIAVGNVYLVVSCWPSVRRHMLVGMSFAVLIVFAWSIEKVAEQWHSGFTEFYEKRLQIESFSRLANRNVAPKSVCALTYRYYPFMGSRRQYSVARPHFHLNYNTFRDYLISHDVGIVVSVLNDPGRRDWYRDPMRWVEERPTVFRKLDLGTGFTIYEVDHEKLLTSF